ncbi:MAG TPA: hypothetical protein VI981_03515 [Candidatus Paceibacterota bacterium]
MNREILDYVARERVGVLAVEMLDGWPHAAAVHFVCQEKPFIFFFETDRTYKKSEPLLSRELSRASFVLGSDESALKTFQLDGDVRVVKKVELETFESVYYCKFPEKTSKAGPDSVFFIFTPRWWRYTDYKKPGGKFILSSDNAVDSDRELT